MQSHFLHSNRYSLSEVRLHESLRMFDWRDANHYDIVRFGLSDFRVFNQHLPDLNQAKIRIPRRSSALLRYMKRPRIRWLKKMKNRERVIYYFQVRMLRKKKWEGEREWEKKRKEKRNRLIHSVNKSFK